MTRRPALLARPGLLICDLVALAGVLAVFASGMDGWPFAAPLVVATAYAVLRLAPRALGSDIAADDEPFGDASLLDREVRR